MLARSLYVHFLVASLHLFCFLFQFSVADSCSPGQFGQNCKFQCHCAGGSTCNDGQCGDSGSCDDAWEGYKCQMGKNVARSKTVSMSSTLPHWSRGGQLAVDGNSNRDFFKGGSCVSTSREKIPWLKIDLGDTFVVQEVTIATVGRDLFYVWDGRADNGGGTRLFPELPGTTLASFSSCLERCMETSGCNATTSCTNHWDGNGCWNAPETIWPRIAHDCKYSLRIDNTLKTLYIRAGNEPNQIGKNSLCKSAALTIDGDTEQRVSCDQMVIGRYIFLQLNNPDDRVLAVCEVMVKGHPFIECRRGYRGITCENACPAGCSTGTTGCNKFNGTCCSQYKTGAQCEKDLPSINGRPWGTADSSSSMTVRWNKWIGGSTSTGVGPVNKYRIQYKMKNSNTWTSVNHDVQTQHGQDPSRKFTNLNHNTYYSFGVACYLTDGLGDVIGKFTESTDIKTECNAPAAVVLNANSISSPLSGRFYAHVLVSWSGISDAASGCDRISEYKVKYKKKGTSYYETVTGSTQLSATIENLYTYTEYEIKVETYNNENKMSTSNVVVYRTAEGYSDAVESVTVTSSGLNQLRVSWNPPKQSRGVITGYKLQSRQVAIGDCDNTVQRWSSEVTVTVTTYTFQRLLPYRKYEVNITPINGAGNGTSHSASTYTAQTAPTGVPSDVQVADRRNMAAVLQWTEVPCSQRNGIVTGYRARITGLEYSSLDRTVPSDDMSINITSLTPFALYSFKVTAVTEAGAGTIFTDDVIFRTLEDVPPAPRHVTIPGAQSTSLDVEWTAPYPPHGEIQKYKLQYEKVDGPPINQLLDSNITAFHVENLETNVSYTIRVRAKTLVGWGSWSTDVQGFTVEGVPSGPQSFKVTQRKVTSLSFSWEEPNYPNGRIIGYKLRCNGEENEIDITLLKATMTGLTPGTVYICSVQARTSAGYGNMSPEVSAVTRPQKVKTKEVKVTDTTITFTVPAFDKNKITGFEVHVDREDLGRKRRAVLNQNGGSYTNCSKNPDERDVYITANQKADEVVSEFTVGDGQVYGGYWNCPLVKDNSYSVFYAAVVEAVNGEKARTFVFVGKYKAKEPQNQDTTIILAVCLPVMMMILVIAGVIVIFILRRRLRTKTREVLGERGPAKNRSGAAETPLQHVAAVGDNHQPEDGDDGETEPEADVIYANAPLSQKDFNVTIQISDLLNYINMKRMGKNEAFKAEYESLPSGLQESLPHTVGSKPENRTKNRFANIMTYDHSRVVLEKLPDDVHSDYINAGYIDGYRKPKKFIACQGATRAMISDIWRMVWQYSISRIVMVTNLVENGNRKCDQYWPNDENDQVYAGITVHLENSEILSDFTVRTFTITKGDKMKTVRQFHYTAWPDHGVPDHATSLLSFRRKIQSFDGVSRGPIVVHCSAGVGRTGTFIALDYLLEEAKAEGQVTVYAYVDYLRQQRVNMIQTLDQYIFLHNAIFEGIRCGDTIVTPPEFLESYEDLMKADPQTSVSKLSEQFELLLSMRLPLNPDSVSSGKLPENAGKNRSMEILPVNSQRPFLSTPVPQSTDYINAIYINGYKQKDTFIVTQMPFPHTCVDLYRLLLEHRSSCVVMLNSVDREDETCVPYWPEDDASALTFGPFTVNLASVDLQTEFLVVRQISLLYKTKATEIKRQIKHFQIKDWPMNMEAPPSAGTILSVLDMVDRWQQQTGNGPVTVHCCDGASRSGVFIAVSYILEKLKLEQEVDIFNAIRHIQIKRPQLIGSEEQYKFCHGAVVEYLKSFETYSNFI